MARGVSPGRIFSRFPGLAMPFALDWDVAEQAVWTALSQLVVVGVAGFVANIVYKRYRDLSTARQELLKNIDEFSRELYTPRKLYQVMIDGTSNLLPDLCTPHERDVRRLETIHQAIADLVAATGRFRTFQVEMIRLYGYNMELLSRITSGNLALPETHSPADGERCVLVLAGRATGLGRCLLQSVRRVPLPDQCCPLCAQRARGGQTTRTRHRRDAASGR